MSRVKRVSVNKYLVAQEQIIVLREMVRKAYSEGVDDANMDIIDWPNSYVKKELDKMFPPEVKDDQS